MSNVVSGNPFVIDTPTACNLYNGRFRLYNIYWASATVGDTLVVQDGGGVQRFTMNGTSGSFTCSDEDGLFFNGIIVPTLTAGTVYIVLQRL